LWFLKHNCPKDTKQKRGDSITDVTKVLDYVTKKGENVERNAKAGVFRRLAPNIDKKLSMIFQQLVSRGDL